MMTSRAALRYVVSQAQTLFFTGGAFLLKIRRIFSSAVQLKDCHPLSGFLLKISSLLLFSEIFYTSITFSPILILRRFVVSDQTVYHQECTLRWQNSIGSSRTETWTVSKSEWIKWVLNLTLSSLIWTPSSLQKEANGDIVNEKIRGRTPLIMAADYGQAKIVEYFLQKGAKINEQDNHGITPLLAAIFEGHTECVRLLLDKVRRHSPRQLFLTFLFSQGCDVTGKTPDGRSYVEVAEKEDIKKLLEAASKWFCDPTLTVRPKKCSISVSRHHRVQKEEKNWSWRNPFSI